MKQIRYFLEYIVIVCIGRFLRLLPRLAVLALGKRAGDFIYYCAPVRKKITLEHIRLAFPEKTGKEVAAIARDAYRNLGMNAFEHLCMPTLSKEDIRQIVKMDNEEVLRNAFARGKGVIFVGGHFGNWEYMGGAISAKGYPLTFVVAGIGNPYIDRMVNQHRMDMGTSIIAKGMSVRAMLKTLRNNEAIAMLMDQDSGRNGIFIEFFGKPCSTPKGPALFALKTGAAIVFATSIRRPDGSLQVIYENIEVDYDKGVAEENIHEIMQRCTVKLESYVRENPGHWFWMHRRWKTPPTVLEGV